MLPIITANSRPITTRTFDSADRLNGSTHTFATSQTQSVGVSEFDSMDRRKKITREDGKRWSCGYNDKGEVTAGTRQLTANPSTPVPGWFNAYTFDGIGNRESATTNGLLRTYTPNALNQYDSRTIPRAFDVIGKANATARVSVNSNATTRLDELFFDLPQSCALAPVNRSG